MTRVVRSRRVIFFVVASSALVLFVVGPGNAQKRRAVRIAGPAPMMSPDCNPALLPPALAEECRASRLSEGKRLFESETFGGNGRTCATCHSAHSGTFSPAEASERLAANVNDPLFLHDGLDDGAAGTSRILQDATVRVTLPLPSHLSIVGRPDIKELTFHRGTPTTKNTPALDTLLMSDVRDQTLMRQAIGAITNHAKSTVAPTPLQLDLIAEFQQKDTRFFSDERLQRFAQTGVPPALPEGTTDAEKRGRLFFVDRPFSPPSAAGVCALCHSGPMLNEANEFAFPVFGSPAGARVFSAGVSERNLRGNPTYTFEVRDGLLNPPVVTTPDIGILMTDVATTPLLAQQLPPPTTALRRAFFANFFKTPTLWGVKNTAPYFHDNSAKDFDEMLEHYNWFFKNREIRGRIELKPQDIEDIKAFMNLL